jgi:drug/metabolite transporter (DMT)-like permease
LSAASPSASRRRFLVACGQFLVCGLISLLWAGVSETITLAGIRQACCRSSMPARSRWRIGFTAQVVGQRYAQPADAAIILSAETVFAALFGFLLMGDRLNASGIAGCALILAASSPSSSPPLTAAAIAESALSGGNSETVPNL